MKKLLNVLAALSICGTVATLALENDVVSAEVKELPMEVSLATDETSTYSSIDFSSKTFVREYNEKAIDWKGYASELEEDNRTNLGLLGTTNVYPKGLYTLSDFSIEDGSLIATPIAVGGTQIYHYDEIKNLKIAGNGYIDETSFYATGDFYFEIECSDVRDPDYAKVTYYTERDLQKPVINGSTTFIVNVNNRLTIDEIATHFSAYDETDGEVEIFIDPNESEYHPNCGVGTYRITIEASDAAGNYATLDVQVKVVDVDKPVISGTKEYTVSYDACPTLDSIKSALTITDNYDNNLSLNLVSDNYSSNIRKVGRWSIVFNSTDSSGNVSDNYEVVVNVQDKIAPVITAPQTITVPTNTKMNVEEIKSKIHVVDGYDGVITNYTLTDNNNYAEKYNKVGTYSFTVTASDSNGNQATFTISIKTEDNIAPEIFVDSYVIVLAQGETLTDAMIKEYASKVLNIDVNTIAEVSGDYDTSTMGKYAIRLSMTDGSTQDFTISVNDTNGDEPKDLGYFEQLWKDFTNIDNMFKFANWNWLHYVAAGLVGLILLSVLASLLKRKK